MWKRIISDNFFCIPFLFLIGCNAPQLKPQRLILTFYLQSISLHLPLVQPLLPFLCQIALFSARCINRYPDRCLNQFSSRCYLAHAQTLWLGVSLFVANEVLYTIKTKRCNKQETRNKKQQRTNNKLTGYKLTGYTPLVWLKQGQALRWWISHSPQRV